MPLSAYACMYAHTYIYTPPVLILYMQLNQPYALYVFSTRSLVIYDHHPVYTRKCNVNSRSHKKTRKYSVNYPFERVCATHKPNFHVINVSAPTTAALVHRHCLFTLQHFFCFFGFAPYMHRYTYVYTYVC